MKIEFVSYDYGDYCLCNGILILKVNEKEVVFGSEDGYPRFWHTGGTANWYEDEVTKAPWIIWEDDLPEELKSHAKEIGELFNDNVPWGCCGGCI